MDKKKQTRDTFTKDFWIYLGVFGFIVTLICFLPYLFTQAGDSRFDFRDTGQIGDTIGGTMGPFIAIAASILTFLAFWVQYKANQQQRKDIALERFENNLFQLIQMQEEITNNLFFTCSDSADNLYGEVFHGRQIFSIIYNDKTYWGDNGKLWGLRRAIESKSLTAYELDKDIHIFDHYFRHLYRVFKYIDDSIIIDDNDKYKYASIMRSSLSQYELILLFYNCLSINGIDKFKPIVEKYALFNNLRTDLLATSKEREQYSKFDAELENNNSVNNYKKGAFIYRE